MRRLFFAAIFLSALTNFGFCQGSGGSPDSEESLVSPKQLIEKKEGSSAPDQPPPRKLRTSNDDQWEYDLNFRFWRDKSLEFEVVAKFVKFLPGGKVRLKRKDSGKLIELDVEILAHDDQKLLERIRKGLVSKAVHEAEDEFKTGMEEFVQLVSERMKAVYEIEQNEDLTTVNKEILLKGKPEEIGKKISKLKFTLVVQIADVLQGGKNEVDLQVEDVFGGPVTSNIRLIRVPLPEARWTKLKKGDMLKIKTELKQKASSFRVTCSIHSDAPPDNRRFLRRRNSSESTYLASYTLSLGRIEVISEEEKQATENLQDWFIELGENTVSLTAE